MGVSESSRPVVETNEEKNVARFNGNAWLKIEDNVRMTLTNTNTRQTLKTSFINNTNQTTIGDKVIDERQPISKPLEIGKNLKPKADN